MTTYFVSGHLDLTLEEFLDHYVPLLRLAVKEGASFIVGDARGADTLTQEYLAREGVEEVRVYHMLTSARNNHEGFRTQGGFMSDSERDKAMTAASDADIAWVRPGRERSGTNRNLKRRVQS